MRFPRLSRSRQESDSSDSDVDVGVRTRRSTPYNAERDLHSSDSRLRLSALKSIISSGALPSDMGAVELCVFDNETHSEAVKVLLMKHDVDPDYQMQKAVLDEMQQQLELEEASTNQTATSSAELPSLLVRFRKLWQRAKRRITGKPKSLEDLVHELRVNNAHVISRTSRKLEILDVRCVAMFFDDLRPLLRDIGNDKSHKNTTQCHAAVAGACKLAFGYKPRDTQLLALNGMDKFERCFAQVATGEGKSLIAAMLAATKALQGLKVEVITSSEVLAVREANDPRVKKFFRLLGLSVAHCITDDWARQWHKADVVYGDALNFQADYLEQIEGAESTESPTTNSRFDCVIYDEVDNILVDNGAVSTLLTYPFPGMEYLELVLHTMFQHVQLLVDKVIYCEEAKCHLIQWEEDQLYHIGESLENFCADQAAKHIKNMITNASVMVPTHLMALVKRDCSEWARSAYRAINFFVEDVHYVLRRQDGYVQKVLRSSFDAELLFVPTYMEKQFSRLPTTIADGWPQWTEAI
ncbi:hypothetical protein AAVH_26834 [Aphelenchoides avenae]|nr:hypothetical protein AAVH_26834 [Aphelenchus avenae]